MANGLTPVVLWRSSCSSCGSWSLTSRSRRNTSSLKAEMKMRFGFVPHSPFPCVSWPLLWHCECRYFSIWQRGTAEVLAWHWNSFNQFMRDRLLVLGQHGRLSKVLSRSSHCTYILSHDMILPLSSLFILDHMFDPYFRGKNLPPTLPLSSCCGVCNALP